jgi:hypothetical protein
MMIVEQATTQPHLVSQSHRWIACSCMVFSLMALTVIYSHLSAPGTQKWS